ncbi:putative colanic acid biosynthesis UDP-glucose lipid carrier transferase [Flavobacterium sp. PL11]|uniref:exopolysaccharide biosynthesis polyprenyl glycosylphosphotransferase n=1 Tax=Flavobacterium sp. PL11 TaxID=3071717 RepID=UPI002DF9D53E|nr:putative colanic acid biosynthesis UDP-glucose lipid carrier transferase [Flavobacterium sp. PL11]
MRNSHKVNFIICCAILDMVAMLIGTLIFLKFINEQGVNAPALYFNKMVLFTFFSWILSVSFYRMYRLENVFSLENFFHNSCYAFLAQRILWHGYMFLFQDDISQYFFTKANLFQLSFLLFYFLFSRILFIALIKQFKTWVTKPYTVAIWGFNQTSIELASYLEENSLFICFKGILNENSTLQYINNRDFSLALTHAIHKASDEEINELYIVSKSDQILDLNYFFELGDRYCMRLKFIPDFSSISKIHFNSCSFNNFHVIIPRFEPLQNPYNRLIKRLFDIIFSLLVIVFILSWLYPIIALIIKQQSAGPVLFKQLRTGKKNTSFWCYKFRSMYINNGDECKQAEKGDTRITPIGKFLRQTSLDEMPQFFNVLVGQMSVVGPRPHMIQHTNDYNNHINNFMVRHFVKPGITGLAQVAGHRGETKKVSDMKKRVNTDIKYVRQWSLITDIKICLMTVIVIFKGDKNAF